MFGTASAMSAAMAKSIAEQDNRRPTRRSSSASPSTSTHMTMRNAVTDMRDAPIDTLLDTAADIITEQIAESKLLTKAGQQVERMPHFSVREITLGRVLGRGGFCAVREIEKIKLANGSGADDQDDDKKKHKSFAKSIAGSFSTKGSVMSSLSKMLRFKKNRKQNRGTLQRSDSFSLGLGMRDSGFELDDLDEENEPVHNTSSKKDNKKESKRRKNKGKSSRRHISKTSTKTTGGGGPGLAFDLSLSKDFIASNAKGGKYVLKRVCLDLKHEDKITYMKGTVDLAMEATFLAALSHPNIISLVGISDKKPNQMGFFIIIDKLKETLTKRLKAWATTERTCNGVTGAVIGSKKKKEDLMRERLEAAFDIANGVEYLHHHQIIFRDLKPDNIGFEKSGALKIFDFGLAKDLSEKDKTANGLYKLTGMTGAMRYMAPEVGLSKPYNLSADVYSWSMIMWYILALEPPFGFYTQEMIQDRVFLQKARPAIFRAWPADVANIMKRSWDNSISKRPSFHDITTVLRQELCDGGSTISSSVEE